MGYFTPITVAVTANPDEPEESKRNVIIIRKWTGGERQIVTSLSTTQLDVMETQLAIKSGGQPRILMDMPKQRLETIKVCVTSWSGPDFEGRPVTPENIASLPPEVQDIVADACDRLNAGLTEEEKKTSASPMNGLSSTKSVQPSLDAIAT